MSKRKAVKPKLQYANVTIRLPKPLIDLEAAYARGRGQTTAQLIARTVEDCEFSAIEGLNGPEMGNIFIPGLEAAHAAYEKREAAEVKRRKS